MVKIGRALGLDPGRRWLGVAISDDEGRLALPLATVDLRAEKDEGVARLQALLGPGGVTRVVVGVPVDAEGREDAQAADFRALGERLAAALGLPLTVEDERFSNPLAASPAPEQRGRGPLSPARRRARRRGEHASAAAAILQRWLDRQRAARPASGTGDEGADP